MWLDYFFYSFIFFARAQQCCLFQFNSLLAIRFVFEIEDGIGIYCLLTSILGDVLHSFKIHFNLSPLYMTLVTL